MLRTSRCILLIVPPDERLVRHPVAVGAQTRPELLDLDGGGSCIFDIAYMLALYYLFTICNCKRRMEIFQRVRSSACDQTDSVLSSSFRVLCLRSAEAVGCRFQAACALFDDANQSTCRRTRLHSVACG
jgi:hypothetical protein